MDAGEVFVQYLRGSGLPAELWDLLLEKLEHGQLGFGNLLQAERDENGVKRVVVTMDISPVKDVYLVPNAFKCTRSKFLDILKQSPDITNAILDVVGSPENQPQGDNKVRYVFDNYWSWCHSAQGVATQNLRAETIWQLPPKELCWMRHTEQEPNAVVIGIPEFAVGGMEAVAPNGISAVWFSHEIWQGQEVTINWLPGNKSVQRAARLLAILGQDGKRWFKQEELNYDLNAVMEAKNQSVPGWSPPGDPRSDNRPFISQEIVVNQQSTIKCWTDYPWMSNLQVAKQMKGLGNTNFQFVEEQEYANVIFATKPIKDFYKFDSSQIVSQFPYEGCLVMKDLLPQTLRRLKLIQSGNQEVNNFNNYYPAFFLPTYDLASEAQHFYHHFIQNRDENKHNTWIIKIAGSTRTADPCISDDLSSIMKYQEAPNGDRVAQLYIKNPLLLGGCKFDVRAYIVVKSFNPNLEAYLLKDFYVRVASGKYSQEWESITNFEQHYTLIMYDEDPEVAKNQVILSREDFIEKINSENVDWAQAENNMQTALKSLIKSGSNYIGDWPRSRAVYGVDIMFDEALQPYVLEVNFSADFSSICKTRNSFVSDIFELMFRDHVGEDFIKV